MPNSNRYNELGQILSHGGEISVGIQISAGKSEREVRAIIQRRWPNLPKSDADKLYGIAKAGSDAASRLNDMSSGDEVQLGMIPIQSYLFGSNPMFSRILMAANINRPDGSGVVTVRHGFATLEIGAAMRRYLEELIDQYQAECAKFANYLREERNTLTEFLWVFVERRY